MPPLRGLINADPAVVSHPKNSNRVLAQTTEGQLYPEAVLHPEKQA
jgi:hypothetical protein